MAETLIEQGSIDDAITGAASATKTEKVAAPNAEPDSNLAWQATARVD
jgi:hypothetical protein